MTDFDLSQFDTRSSANEGAWLHLRNPFNLSEPLFYKEKPIRIRLLGKDSDKFKKQSAAATNLRLKEQSKGRGASLTTEQLEAETLSLLAVCSMEWENIILDGEELPLSVDNARLFYKRFPAFKEQADDFIGARENFMKTS